MPRPTIIERARLYLDRIPGAVSGQNGHDQTFSATCVLVKGFGLTIDEARPLLQEWNGKCCPAWSAPELEHKLRQADQVPDKEPRGYLLKDDDGPCERGQVPAVPAQQYMPPPKPEFDSAKLKAVAGKLSGLVDLVWLADRSVEDPATVDSARFLELLYKPGENVAVFTKQFDLGPPIWPAAELPRTGKEGVWFLAQPVDGKAHVNPRSVKYKGEARMSYRSMESVTEFRFLVLESDKADMMDWLGALVQLPLRIAAIYTSGSRSIHALVQVDCKTKGYWDHEKYAMKHGLIVLGADPGALSGVRLSRLPGCFREGKMIKERLPDGKEIKRYEKFPRPVLQKLLYINPDPHLRPLAELPRRRDVVDYWTAQAALGVADGDEDGGRWLAQGLAYYAPRSKACADALKNFKIQAEERTR